MDNTRSTFRGLNHNDDASSSSSRKRSKTFEKGGVGPWSDLDLDVLLLVMMQLGVVDFIAFSGVCKSWRSLALANRNMFMSFKPPMCISIEPRVNNQEDAYCYMKDFEGRTFKTIIPHSAGRSCFGVTRGYLVLFGRKTRDFWLVNPITRHELHFPDLPSNVGASKEMSKGILVFSPSISGWVFVLLHRKISFSIAGKQRWNHVSSTVPIIDLHVFKGKIYTLHKDCTLSELILHPNQKRKWTLLETNNYPNPDFRYGELVSSGENLYMISQDSIMKKVMEVDFFEMKWVSPGKTIEEYAFFVSYYSDSAVFKVESWADPPRQHTSYDCFVDDDKSRTCMFFYKDIWYFPHECLNVNLLDE